MLLLTSSFSNETRPRVASWHLNVVRASKIALLAAGISAILVVGIFAVRLIFAWHHPPSAAPAASITLLGYTNITRSNPDSNVFVYPGRGEWLLARMILKNEGKGSILYKAWGDEPYGWANAQTGQGLTNGFLAPPYGFICSAGPRLECSVFGMASRRYFALAMRLFCLHSKCEGACCLAHDFMEKVPE